MYRSDDTQVGLARNTAEVGCGALKSCAGSVAKEAKERFKTIGRVDAARFVVLERTRTVGRVTRTICVELERIATGGSVGVAGSVAKERVSTGGRVGVTICVAKKGSKTSGSVGVAGGVVKERVSTNGRVVEDGGEAEKRVTAFSRVCAQIASVRGWVDCSRRRQKRKPCEGEREREEKQAVSPRRPGEWVPDGVDCIRWSNGIFHWMFFCLVVQTAGAGLKKWFYFLKRKSRSKPATNEQNIFLITADYADDTDN